VHRFQETNCAPARLVVATRIQVATALARLGDRPRWTAEDDLVFCGTSGGYLDGSALRCRYLVARQTASAASSERVARSACVTRLT
jgi:hypothetical protein